MLTRKWRNLLSDAFIRRFVRYSENYPKTNKDKAFNKVCSPSSNCHNYCESTLVGMHCRKYKTHVTKNFEDYTFSMCKPILIESIRNYTPHSIVTR